MVRHASSGPEEATYSRNALDSMRNLTIDIKNKISDRNVDFSLDNGIPTILIEYADEADIYLLQDLQVRAEDPAMTLNFDQLEVLDKAGNWTWCGVPNPIVQTKIQRDFAVAQNKVRVNGKKSGAKFISLDIPALSIVDDISGAYDPALSLLGKLKRAKGLTLSYMR